MTFDNLKSNIRVWIENTLGVTVIYSHGNGPRPTEQYAVMNVLNITKLMEDVRTETRLVGGEIQADYEGVKKVMVSINVYRGDAQEQLIKLRLSLGKISGQDYFNNLDIGIVNQNDVLHVPEQIGQAWEDRAQCDFFFHFIPTIEADADISEIKTIEVLSELNNELIISQ